MEKKKIQAHGLTHEEMKSLHEDQIAGQIEKILANNLDTISDPYFKEEFGEYEIKSYNLDIYHIAMEKREFKTIGGLPRKTSTAHVVKMNKEEYAQATAKGSRAFNGFITHILHIPGGKAAIKQMKDDNAQGDGDGSGNGSETVMTLEAIKSLTSAKEAKEIYQQVTGEEATKNWTLEKTQQEIISFLGMDEPPAV